MGNDRLARAFICWLVGLAPVPATAAAPEAHTATSATKPAVPRYRVYPLRNGACKIAGNHAFSGGNNAETYDYTLYVWLVLGGDKPILVDAGLNNVAEMNRGAAHVLREPIRQCPGESARAQLRRFGLKPEDIGHVLVTHMHFDHVDGLDDFPNAKVYIGRKEWGPWCDGRIMTEFNNNPQWKARLVRVGDEEILPGIESFWVGGHTPGSTAYRIHTAHGYAVLTGDTVSLLANIERDIPVGVADNRDECLAAMRKIRQKANVILPSHDPDTPNRWPPLPAGTPRYTIRAIRVGECEVRDYITFQDVDEVAGQKTKTYALYVWLIEGGPRPVLVETGPNPRYVQAFNRATAKYIPGGVKQKPEEDTLQALKRAGIDPLAISHVIVTHAHGDHCDYYPAFVNARFVINRREYEDSKDHLAGEVGRVLAARPELLQLVGDEEVLPGIRTLPLGCHTPGSQGVLVQTRLGPAMLTGDVVYRYENIEQDRPSRSSTPEVCRESMRRIRSLADIVLPAHDPETLVRWPDGVIGHPPPPCGDAK
ncbi:MAG TPA: N-acyl homoserine lactonase family protein [Phycisphaerae bacterium]|nr:N-acyl homoserine lactonase family protein [Phycisphaerae bacterium]HRY70919.1 N-acyl homoserine lactonase family protein [Phycisphaerae bacterium]HSA27784.1 N-acyl homoserine lactonase family protein [Phycisphaerae bacterium]